MVDSIIVDIQYDCCIVFLKPCTKVYKGDGNKGQETIIGFYNRVYMVAMKSTILQFAPNKIPPVSPSLKSSVRYSMSSKTSLYFHVRFLSFPAFAVWGSG